MDVYRTEEEQVETIKKWWEENGKIIIAGVVIGIAAIFGWRAYDNHLIKQAEAASTLYEQMLIASRKNDAENVKIYADRIITDYQSTTYGIFAKLMLAKLAVNIDDLTTAESELRWVLNNSSQIEFQHIARLRLVRVLIAAAKLDDAAELLTLSNTGKFTAHYDELRGDIFVKQDRIDKARQAYKKALANLSATNVTNSTLEMKLDDLGRD